MLFVLTAICWLIVFYIGGVPYLHAPNSDGGWELLYGFSIFVGGVMFVVSFVLQLTRWYAHADDIEQLIKIKDDRKTYEQEKEMLVEEFKLYLADSYPEHERKIFESIKPENVTAYMIQYPEIKANETIMALCEKIESLTQNIFECDRDYNKITKNIRLRKRSMWLTSIPTLPKE